MNWVIVVLVVLSLIGSVLWVMPSPYQRMQARLRSEAMRRGLQVQMARVLIPRQEGEAHPEERACIAYRLPRSSRDPEQGERLWGWQVFRARGWDNRGLPSGWCWSKGEDLLGEGALQRLQTVIVKLPKEVFALESTPVALSVYWHESGQPDALDRVQGALEELSNAGL